MNVTSLGIINHDSIDIIRIASNTATTVAQPDTPDSLSYLFLQHVPLSLHVLLKNPSL